MVRIGTKTAEHALHDSTEIAPNFGFIPDVTGNFEGQLRFDTGDSTFFVVAGVYYAEDIRLAKDTSSANTTQLRIIYEAEQK
jgi:hypothetical protein